MPAKKKSKSLQSANLTNFPTNRRTTFAQLWTDCCSQDLIDHNFQLAVICTKSFKTTEDGETQAKRQREREKGDSRASSKAENVKITR